MELPVDDASAFDDLPPDQYGVLVVDEVDAIRLKWLVAAIGETKLRRSIAKYSIQYPGCRPYVSLLLTRFHLKVPVRLYAAVPVPVYWVYLLRMRCAPKMKVGMTGRWPFRAWDFVRKANEPDPNREQLAQTFDLEASRAWLVGGNKAEARHRETMVKAALAPWRVAAPWHDGHTNYGASGHTEWFDDSQWIAACDLACTGDGAASAPVQTLMVALEIALSSPHAGIRP